MESMYVFFVLFRGREVTSFTVKRLWECAERTTRKESGIDGAQGGFILSHLLYIPAHCAGVAVLTVLRSKTKAFPLSTVIIEQYRPPLDNIVIGMLQLLSPAFIH